MDKNIPYLDYLVNGINKADGTTGSIDAVIDARDQLRIAQNLNASKNKEIKPEPEIPDDLVAQIKEDMGAITNEQQEKFASGFEQLNDTVQKLISGGEEISSVEITDDKVTIKNKNDNTEELEPEL